MKFCPICQQAYSDETLNFCLEDGLHLVSEEFISNSPTIEKENERRAKPTAHEK